MFDSESRSPFIGLIYGVRELGSVEFRYVGLTTKTVAKRRVQHLASAARGQKTPFADWLRKQCDAEAAYFASLELVMSDDLNDLGRAEQRWIERLRDEGHRLLNLTEGGIGSTGYKWSAERREAASRRMLGVRRPYYPSGPDHPRWGATHSDEQKAQWSIERKGMNAGAANPNFGKFGAEHPSFGHKLSPESRERLSAQKRGELNPNFGKKMSDEDRKKRSDALKGRPMPSSARSAHTRHHVNKSVFKDTCKHCLDDQRSQATRGNDND